MILKETGTIPATALPVQELAEHLRLGHGFTDDGAEDALLERLLREAVALVEQRLAVAVFRRGFLLEVSAWDRRGHLVLPVGPVEAVQSLELVSGGTATAVDASEWMLEKAAVRQRVAAPDGGALPSLDGGTTARAAFDAGYAQSWSEVPGDLARAIMLLAAHAYDNRHGEDDGVPGGLLALLDLRRPVRL
ncbi:MAG TPA: hypothetical protein VMM55_07435 [Thermohalobaculum sp.]|nr:hypothetical protein [Thermohalobaculum sp.]